MKITNSFRRSSRAGFTLVELLIVVAIAGYLLYQIVPNSSKAKYGGEVATMKTRAANLNLAQSQYVEANGTNGAIAAWSTLTTDDSKYQAVKPYLTYPPSNLTTYALAGWSITFASDPRQPVVLMNGSTVISYQ